MQSGLQPPVYQALSLGEGGQDPRPVQDAAGLSQRCTAQRWAQAASPVVVAAAVAAAALVIAAAVAAGSGATGGVASAAAIAASAAAVAGAAVIVACITRGDKAKCTGGA